jgi:hypothetical protein
VTETSRERERTGSQRENLNNKKRKARRGRRARTEEKTVTFIIGAPPDQSETITLTSSSSPAATR